MATPTPRKKSLNLTKRPTRKLAPHQAYSRLYYKTKVKPIVRASWEKHLARHPNKNTKADSLNHRNAVIKAVFEAETDEVKVEVEKRREMGDFSEYEDIDSDGDGDDDADDVERQRRRKALSIKRNVLFFFLHFQAVLLTITTS